MQSRKSSALGKVSQLMIDEINSNRQFQNMLTKISSNKQHTPILRPDTQTNENEKETKDTKIKNRAGSVLPEGACIGAAKGWGP